MPQSTSVTSALAADLPAILALSRAVGVFSAEEVSTIEELFLEYLESPEKSGYNFLVYRQAADLLGFACWGPTPLSKGTCDLYWICTAATSQRQGVGQQLFQAVCAEVQRIERWLLMIWTSSRPEYAPARRFYQQQGCELAAQITDFYERGEDLCAFVRRL